MVNANAIRVSVPKLCGFFCSRLALSVIVFDFEIQMKREVR
jgi:hypothetical protein